MENPSGSPLTRGTGKTIENTDLDCVLSNITLLSEYNLATLGKFKSKVEGHTEKKTVFFPPGKEHPLPDFDNILNRLKNPTSLDSLIKRLATVHELKNIDSIVIYYHMRGQSNVNGIHYQREQTTNKLKCDVARFTTLFNQIKKSKNKVFSNSAATIDLIPTIGTYLAETVTTKLYDLIFIISRNEFLPPDTNEIAQLSFVAKASTPFFTKVLHRKDVESRFEMVHDILNTSLIPFRVLKEGKELFRTKNYADLKDISSLATRDENIIIEYENTSGLTHASEIFHFQRVGILGELLNTLRHELNNPLFGIQLSSELLLLESGDDESSEFMQEILNSTQRCQNIIKDFTTLYKAEDNYERFNLIKVVKEAITLSKSATQNIKKKIIYGPEIESLEIYSNPQWINHIVFNAIINSAEALNSEEPSLKKTITIKIEHCLTDVSITIQDNGPGIKDISQQSLFRAFCTTKKDGTGLGLAICKTLADKLNAEVYLSNNDTRGCCFTLILKNEKNTTC